MRDLEHSCMNPSACVICLRAASSPDEGSEHRNCTHDRPCGDCLHDNIAPPPASADEGTRQRPGGWVDGIGWVALKPYLVPGDQYVTRKNTEPWTVRGTCWTYDPVIVTCWADGTTPAPPAPSTPAPQADEQIRQDAAWIARLARGSSWPGEMAQRVEDACDRVTRWAATPPSTPAEPDRPASSSGTDR